MPVAEIVVDAEMPLVWVEQLVVVVFPFFVVMFPDYVNVMVVAV